MVTLKRFDKAFWRGMAGATRFDNGAEPFFGIVSCNEQGNSDEHLVVADAEGFSLISEGIEYSLDFNAFFMLQDSMTQSEIETVQALGKVKRF
jgi:hypothetical protein